MPELFVAADVVRRQMRNQLEARPEQAKEAKSAPPRRHRVRSSSAAALRVLADRLEPSRA
jgi:hypothetical protein